MHINKTVLISFVLFFSVSAYSQGKDLAEFVEQYSDSMITTAKQPGMIISITCGDKVIYEKAKGYANIETKQPMDKTMRFRIGSLTKTFTTTVLLQLVDEGMLKLDDVIDKFFPQIPNAKNITVRMLGNMTSGLNNYTENQEFWDSISTNPRKKWEPGQLVEISLRNGTYFEPGKGGHYSNTNTVLIGMIIEKLTGSTLEAEIKKRIIDKLTLKETEFPGVPEITGYYTKGYNEDGNAFVEPLTDITDKYDPSWAWAAGAMISTIDDLKIYMKALTEGTLISKESQKERLKWAIEKPGSKYGFGIFTEGDDYLGHNGSCPGYRNISLHSPKSNCTIIIFYNSQTNHAPEDLMDKILELMEKK